MSGARWNLSMRRVRQIGMMMAMLCCLGYVLQVSGWHLQDITGGVKAHYPVFLSRELLGTLCIVAGNAVLSWWLCAQSRRNDGDSHPSPGHAEG